MQAVSRCTMRVIIVEDDQLLLENLKILLGSDAQIDVVGAFPSAEDALPKLNKLDPEVMIADLGLPGISGIEMIRTVKEEMPAVEIMAHTVFDERDTVFAAIKAGASGYLLKGSSPLEIIQALHKLYEGGSPMSQKIARKVIMEFQDEAVEDQYLLTHREKDIVKSIENGLTYKEIANKFNISPHTVHTHIKNIYEKLQAKDRQEALVKARRKGII